MRNDEELRTALAALEREESAAGRRRDATQSYKAALSMAIQTLMWVLDEQEGFEHPYAELMDRPDPTPRLRTHQRTMRGYRVSKVPLHSIMSIYCADGPEEVEILDRTVTKHYTMLSFANGDEAPYSSNAIVHVFAPLDLEDKA